MGRLKIDWPLLVPSRVEAEESLLRRLPFFELESFSVVKGVGVRAIGVLKHVQPRTGRHERLRVRLEYPDRFPRQPPKVFDHEKRFRPSPDGHMMPNYELCLAYPERMEFTLGAANLTEEVLGAALIWFDKASIFARTGKWPGDAEAHGHRPLIEIVLERAGLSSCEYTRAWLTDLYQRWLGARRGIEVDVYAPCPCRSGEKLKFCHRQSFRPFLNLLEEPASPGGK